MSHSITTEEWKQEIAAIQQDDEGLTIRELMEAFGQSHSAVRERMQVGVRNGRYIAGWKTYVDSMGRKQRIPVYRLAKGKPT
jgi:response regulator of citrate/malate metabolism